MKTLVVYYSFTGKTRTLAQKKAKKTGGQLLEVREAKKRSVPGAYFFGSFAAMRHKQAVLAAFEPDFAQYERILVLAPIWAGAPAPAFNTIMAALPRGKEVELIFTSGSGSSGKSQEYCKRQIAERGCRLVSCTDVKTS